MSQLRIGLLIALMACGLGGCASGATAALGAIANVAMQAAGLKKDDKAAALPKNVALQIHAGANLNSGESGEGLAVVVRIFKLRDPNAFMSAPQGAFGNLAREKEALGDDLLEARDVVLTPGQKILAKERMTVDMAYLGVVALFRTPAPERWRFAFAQGDIEKTGVTIGAHACALTVSSGKAYGFDASTVALLSPVECELPTPAQQLSNTEPGAQ